MATRITAPEDALHVLAEQLEAEESVITPRVSDSDEPPALGLLAAAGPRAAGAPAEYALLIESVREGYLLHYGEPRVIVGADNDLALLAGDYLYARGLERLAALGDLEAIRELSDLISLSAQLHAEEREGADELWLASVVTVAAGPGERHTAAKDRCRRGDPDFPAALWRATAATAAAAGLGDPLESAAEAIGFEPR